jgi:hypothetical protein
MGDGAIRNGPAETYYCQPRCRDPSGDDYVTFTGKTVLISASEGGAFACLAEAVSGPDPAVASSRSDGRAQSTRPLLLRNIT